MKQTMNLSLILTVMLLTFISPVFSQGDSSKNSLDWAGTYSGIVPCASCEGIKTTLTISKDAKYVLTTSYLGKRQNTVRAKGKFKWTRDGSKIVLQGLKKGEGPTIYRVEENQLRQLDMAGNVIAGALAEKYVLRKQDASQAAGTPQAEDKRWKLIELNGRPVKGNAKTHYLIFHAQEKRLEAKADCNVMSANYEIKNGWQLQVSSVISTRMACPEGNVENEFREALETADNLTVKGKFLSLNKARRAPLARFELVK